MHMLVLARVMVIMRLDKANLRGNCPVHYSGLSVYCGCKMN